MIRAFAMLLAALGLAAFTAHAQQLPPQQFAELGTCPLESGASIQHCRLGYRLFGKLDAARDNAVLFPMWLSGHSGDVSVLVGPGPGHFVDTDRYYVIVVDPFANGVSSSPSNSPTQHGTAFPVFTIRDVVHAEERLVRDTLHLRHLHAVMGESLGGLQTFEWGVDAPDMMDELIPIAGTPQFSSYDLMFWTMVKQALLTDPGYDHGHYTRNPALPMVNELTQLNLATPAYRVDHTTREGFPEYFKRVGAELNVGVDANDYLRQVQAALGQDIAHGGSIYVAARSIHAKMFIINGQQDHMVNPILPLAFARVIGARTLVLTSDCGHMAPGCELQTVSPALSSFLDSGR